MATILSTTRSLVFDLLFRKTLPSDSNIPIPDTNSFARLTNKINNATPDLGQLLNLVRYRWFYIFHFLRDRSDVGTPLKTIMSMFSTLIGFFLAR